MAVEQMRGCGYRKVGGLYLCGSGAGMDCDRLPYELEICPVCGSGIKFTRGWTWIDWLRYAGTHTVKLPGEQPSGGPVLRGCDDPALCPVCYPEFHPQPYGLLWVGEASYSPQSFVQEALTMGVSRKIAGVPKNLKLGETWVLFAYKKLILSTTIEATDGRPKEGPGEYDAAITDTGWRSGIFYAFRPQSLELLIWESEAKPEYLEDLEKRNVTPIIIPDGDEDHHPDTKTKVSADDRADVDIRNKITVLRKSIS